MPVRRHATKTTKIDRDDAHRERGYADEPGP
jgi:hypothetical protein